MADEPETPESLQETVDIVLGSLDKVIADLKEFVEYRNNGVDFWYQYAMENTRDKKLQEIASYDLKSKEMGDDLVQRFTTMRTLLHTAFTITMGNTTKK